MLLQPTIEKMYAMKLGTMAAALQEDLARGPSDLSFEDRLGLLIDREWSARQDKRCTTRIRSAKLRQSACVENVDYRAKRNLDRGVFAELATCRWVKAGRNLVITGPAGVGKSWLACALGNQACREGMTALNHRTSRLVDELSIARADGSFLKMLDRLAKVDLLILDDWALGEIDSIGYQHLHEVLDDRCNGKATLVTSQLPTSHWYDKVGNATLADAILDRLLRKATQINLKGDSLRV